MWKHRRLFSLKSHLFFHLIFETRPLLEKPQSQSVLNSFPRSMAFGLDLILYMFLLVFMTDVTWMLNCVTTQYAARVLSPLYIPNTSQLPLLEFDTLHLPSWSPSVSFILLQQCEIIQNIMTLCRLDPSHKGFGGLAIRVVWESGLPSVHIRRQPTYCNLITQEAVIRSN